MYFSGLLVTPREVLTCWQLWKSVASMQDGMGLRTWTRGHLRRGSGRKENQAYKAEIHAGCMISRYANKYTEPGKWPQYRPGGQDSASVEVWWLRGSCRAPLQVFCTWFSHMCHSFLLLTWHKNPSSDTPLGGKKRILPHPLGPLLEQIPWALSHGESLLGQSCQCLLFQSG